ncbi:patched domain-containing 3-like [Pelobates cultripes]|uniref:Patched domain-containing 3-like n=1 Tax=Pelobates cultripes TaxID=61616 RepID=A0AAD1W2K9_PELCU|nr:patched domain-containing 3-like [Pelobates cultripes]
MAGFHTDCIEKPLSRGFRQLGWMIGRYPWWFLVIPILVSAGLGAGFYFLPQREAYDIEEQFTPIGGPSKKERDFIKTHFPVNDTGQFSATRLYTEGSFVSLIAVSLFDNVLTANAFRELLKLDEKVRSLNVSKSDLGKEENLTFSQLCAEIQGLQCLDSNPLLSAVQSNPDKIETIYVTFPMFQNTFLGKYLGGVTLGPEEIVQKARAVRLVYYLREDSGQDKAKSLLWINHFINSIPNEIRTLNLTNIEWQLIGRKSMTVSYFTSVSRQTEFEDATKSVIPLYSITYFVTITFSIMSCTRLHRAGHKLPHSRSLNGQCEKQGLGRFLWSHFSWVSGPV